jgi:hypothetical protein
MIGAFLAAIGQKTRQRADTSGDAGGIMPHFDGWEFDACRNTPSVHNSGEHYQHRGHKAGAWQFRIFGSYTKRIRAT